MIKYEGSIGYADVYKPDSIKVDKCIDAATNFFVQIITAQPTQPFMDLTLTTATNGSTLNLVSGGKGINRNPGQVKQSSLFRADNGTITQDASTPVRFYHYFSGQHLYPESQDALKPYSDALISAIQNNSLTSTDYDDWFRKAFVAGAN